MEEPLSVKKFDLKTFRRWRTVQLASLLPLVLSGVFMLYFKEASPLGIMAFFLVLIVGILLPQVRGDMILSHLVLARELEERSQRLEEKIGELIEERLEEKQTSK